MGLNSTKNTLLKVFWPIFESHFENPIDLQKTFTTDLSQISGNVGRKSKIALPSSQSLDFVSGFVCRYSFSD